MQIEIQTDKIIKVDDRLELNSPKIIVESAYINLTENNVSPTLRFEGPGYSYARIIEPMEFEPGWTAADLEVYFLNWVASREVV